ncbi:cell division protein FtsQ/DivIB [Sphingomonas montana]|uniref:cell division protein FtsQ/DivIB n=1 Tax=Sphingomonas montana TaxID=1843236 RepID=UPI00096F41E7|nr:cell division protein FtsQ/DivIB [Sphingomonas montana]
MTGPAKIRRGTSTQRKRPTVTRSTGRRAVAKRPSTIAQAIATIPLPAALIKRIGNWLIAIVLAVGVIAGVLAMRVPQMVGMQIGEAVGVAGFRVRNIEIVGIDQADRAAVYDVAVDQTSRAMPLVDLEAIRARLMRFGWIADARVSRRLPDTLVIDIVERRAAAIWQHKQKLALIDRAGVVIAPVDLSAMPENLPIVIGPGANRQAANLNVLMETAPALKPMLAGASWIGDRRWDLRFQSGETLALPEGQAASMAALRKFTAMDGRARLLGQGFVRFDMRMPDRFVVRVSREPGHKVTETALVADKNI